MTTKSTRNLERWKCIANYARDRMHQLESAENEAKLSSLVGKYFKFRNNYSFLRQDECWWTYFAVTSVENGEIKGWAFSKNYKGIITIEDFSHQDDSLLQFEIIHLEFLAMYGAILYELNDKMTRELPPTGPIYRTDQHLPDGV